MAEYNDILIFGVRRTAQTGDTGFIVTPDEFGQMLGDDPDTLLNEIRSAREAFGDSVWAGFDKDGDTYSVRMVKMVEDISKDITGAAAYMAKSINHFGSVPFAFPTQAVREELSKFLDPDLRLQNDQPDHNVDFYNYNVGCIFQSCGLLHVERHRSSVTQGEAYVMAGKDTTIVQFFDDIHRPSPNQLLGMSLSSADIQSRYGPIVDGWVSRFTDAFLIQGALHHYPDRIRTAIRSEKLQPPRTAAALDTLISGARSRTNTAEQTTPKDLSR